MSRVGCTSRLPGNLKQGRNPSVEGAVHHLVWGCGKTHCAAWLFTCSDCSARPCEWLRM